MINRSPLKSTGADLEKAATERFCSLAVCMPPECKVYRETWGRSTVLCLNFEACPNQLEATRPKVPLLLAVAQQLGLANSIILKVGNIVKGWTRSRVENV